MNRPDKPFEREFSVKLMERILTA